MKSVLGLAGLFLFATSGWGQEKEEPKSEEKRPIGKKEEGVNWVLSHQLHTGAILF